MNGEVYLGNNHTVKTKNLRYNGYFDQLVYLNSGNSQQIKIDKEQVERFCLYNSVNSYCFKKIKIRKELSLTPDTITVYAQVLFESKISLYAHRNVEITGTVIDSKCNCYKDVYTNKYMYYFKTQNGKTIGFKRFKKKDIIKLFPDKKELILNKFRSTKQRRFRNESDLVNIATALNEII